MARRLLAWNQSMRVDDVVVRPGLVSMQPDGVREVCFLQDACGPLSEFIRLNIEVSTDLRREDLRVFIIILEEKAVGV